MSILLPESRTKSQDPELDRELVREGLPSQKGSYLLILKSSSNAVITVGRKGSLTLKPGYYLYIGSALGPGGLSARVARHADRIKKSHWHIDYLRPHLRLFAVCFIVCSERLEDAWSQQVGAWSGAEVPMQGFGASDRQLGTHLYYFQEWPGASSPVSLGGKEIHCLESGGMEIRA